MRGHVDLITFTLVSGWAVNPDGTPVEVEIIADGKRVGSAKCSIFREGLKKNGISDGYSGFGFVLSPPLDIWADHTIAVRPVGSTDDLPGKRLLSRIDLEDFRRRGFAVDYPVGQLSIHQCAYSSKYLKITGVLLTNGAPPSKIRILNGGLLRSVAFEAGVVEPTLKAFDFRRWKFEATIEDFEETVVEGEVTIDDGRACTPRAIFVVPGRSYNSSYIPPADSIKRVVGPISHQQFAIRGLTDAKRFVEMVGAYLDISIPGRWLDWGCGPGRIAVPLKRQYLPKWDIHGVDVDEYNIQIAKELSPDVHYGAVGFDPPLPFRDQYFDVVHGLSVLTSPQAKGPGYLAFRAPPRREAWRHINTDNARRNYSAGEARIIFYECRGQVRRIRLLG